MMTTRLARIAVLRKDGLHYHTDVSGWNMETVAIKLFGDAKAEPRTICVVWFEGPNESNLEPRQQHWSC